MPSLLLAFQISIEVPTEALTWVIKVELFVDCLYLDILRIKFKIALKVCFDARLGLALRNDRISPGGAPCQSHLSTSLAVLFADLHEDRIVHEFAHILATIIDLVLITEGTILCDMGTLRLMEFCEIASLQPWMHLDLVYSRNLEQC